MKRQKERGRERRQPHILKSVSTSKMPNITFGVGSLRKEHSLKTKKKKDKNPSIAKSFHQSKVDTIIEAPISFDNKAENKRRKTKKYETKVCVRI